MINAVTITDHRGTRKTHHLFERDEDGVVRCMRCYLGFMYPKARLFRRLKAHAAIEMKRRV